MKKERSPSAHKNKLAIAYFFKWLFILSVFLLSIGATHAFAKEISGYIRTSFENGIGGVTVTFDKLGSTTTNSSGYYSKGIPNGWSGTVTPSRGGYSFAPTSRSYNNLTSNLSNQNYTEVEAQVLLRLTVNRVGSGNVAVNPDRDFYPEGSSVTLTATADSGWVFSKWSGQLDSSDNPERISINSNMVITAVFVKNVDNDVDDDGISNEEENSGPGNGDGNNDGIPDSRQSHVGYLSLGNETDYVALETPPGTAIKNCRAVFEPPDTNYPSDVDFLYGFFSFTVEDIGLGGSTSVRFYFSSEVAFNTYSKYGPTPDDPFDHWYEFIFDGQTGADIDETDITLYFVDGGRGDDDLTRDGKIVDIGGPGVRAVLFPESASDANAVGDDGYGCFVEGLH
jgi:hypothetical protein